ncbi:MAG: hypothetical protein JWP49_1968 [Phenylobacterium sp.]|nr:hypothetical protein [Phenylobacterium sp.]
MRHARPEDLEPLVGLLAQLRALPGLTERTPGTFYRKARAFLHFHHDPKGLFADLRGPDDGDFERIDVTAPGGQTTLLALARERLA